MKARSVPRQIATRSRSALEAMCVAVVRRLPGLEGVRHVAVEPLEAGMGEPNWTIGEVSVTPPIDEAGRERVEAALSSWRHRFRLA